MINMYSIDESEAFLVSVFPKINTFMSNKTLPADKFFQDVDFISIVDTIRNVYMSDGSMSILLDFERVLDDADLYAYKNWLMGELVQGPVIGRYTITCLFMWPYKLMPDPRGALRLHKIGCEVRYGKSELEVPVEVKDYEDFVPGTRYPKMHKRKVWFVEIRMPSVLVDNIKESSINLSDDTIDLSEIEDAYNEDLDDSTKVAGQAPKTEQEQAQFDAGGQMQ